MSAFPRIGFLGGGNMAEAIIGGLLQAGCSPAHLRVGEPRAERCRELAERFAITADADNAGVVAHSEVLILAVKPQVMRPVLAPLVDAITARAPLVISIAAGVTMTQLGDWLHPSLPLVRSMPNTPALVAAGVTGLYASAMVSTAHREQAERIMASVGAVHWVNSEGALDALMAISGCGPAYVFAFIEHLQQAGVALGLEADMSAALARDTVWGATRLLRETGVAPDELRRRVTSPGGTTQAALESFTRDDLAGVIHRATAAAVARVRELADE